MQANLGIRESQLELARAEIDEFEASMTRWLPVFEVRAFTSVVKDADGTIFDDIETSWGDIGPYFQITGEAAQPITTFGRISSLRRAARHGVQAREAGVQVRRADVAGDVYRYYYGILLARQLLGILNDADGKLNTIRNRVRSMIDEGSDRVTPVDLAKLDVYAFELDRKRFRAEKTIRLALAALRRELAIPYDTPFDIQNGRLRRIRDDIPALDSLQRAAFRRRPEVRQVEAGVQARYHQWKAEKSRRYPELFIGMDWNLEYAPGRHFGGTNPHTGLSYENAFVGDGYNGRSVRAALGARWQLGLSGREADIRRAHVDYREMVRKRVWARQSIALEVQKSYEDALEARQNSRLGSRSRGAGWAWLLQTGERYDLGIASTRDLLEAYGAYLKSQSDYYQTLYDDYLAMAALYRTVGRPIWEIGDNGR